MRQCVFRSKWERTLGKTESPIESHFMAAFCEVAFDHGYEIGKNTGRFRIGIEPQKHMDRIRLDFLISYMMHKSLIEIAVECDGHDYHERTKQQAAKDRSRDRALQALGLKVFRFTGSEIYADARGCAVEVLDAIEEFQTATIVDDMERRAA